MRKKETCARAVEKVSLSEKWSDPCIQACDWLKARVRIGETVFILCFRAETEVPPLLCSTRKPTECGLQRRGNRPASDKRRTCYSEETGGVWSGLSSHRERDPEHHGPSPIGARTIAEDLRD